MLRWIAIPGFLIGLAMMFTLQEPRQQAAAAAAAPAAAGPVPTVVQQPKAAAASAAAAAPVAAPPLKAVHKEQAQPAAAAGAKEAAKAEAPADSSSRGGIWTLLCSKGFMSVTLAAALNDVGSYALIAWQSTFYERVYGLESSAYAPVLAALLPIGGILGGVGEWGTALAAVGNGAVGDVVNNGGCSWRWCRFTGCHCATRHKNWVRAVGAEAGAELGGVPGLPKILQHAHLQSGRWS